MHRKNLVGLAQTFESYHGTQLRPRQTDGQIKLPVKLNIDELRSVSVSYFRISGAINMVQRSLKSVADQT